MGKNELYFITGGSLMGALKKTLSSIGDIVSSYDGEKVRFSPNDRHEKLVRKVQLGSLFDTLHMQTDLLGAMNKWNIKSQKITKK